MTENDKLSVASPTEEIKMRIKNYIQSEAFKVLVEEAKTDYKEGRILKSLKEEDLND